MSLLHFVLFYSAKTLYLSFGVMESTFFLIFSSLDSYEYINSFKKDLIEYDDRDGSGEGFTTL
jgi:hypothetical protein